MEIEVGECVRNEDGYIWKIKNIKDLDNIFIDEDGKLKEIAGETVFGDDVIVEITKHSKNIIDLVEVGDYVNGNKVISVDYDVIDNKTECIELDLNNNYQYNFISARQIKSIVTHEQFASIEYKVEEDKNEK